MKEYVTEAVVLDKEPQGESDLRVSLFTEALGKVQAKVTSGRKITSKLAPHLEPLNIVSVRLVQKSGLVVTDALKVGTLPRESIKSLALLEGALMPQSRDYRLWLKIKEGAPVKELLGLLGFDPAFASCVTCGAGYPDYFYAPESIYVCGNCVPIGASVNSGYVEVSFQGGQIL